MLINCGTPLQCVVSSSVTGLKWAGHVARRRERRVVYRFGGETFGKENNWKTQK